MKKYQFNLERVLNLKRMQEKLKLKDLGEEVKSQLELQSDVDESRSLKHRFDQRYHQIEREGRLDPLNFRLHQSYSAVLGQEIKKGEDKVEEQKLKVDQVREQVRLAHRETKSFEMLKEKSLNQYIKEYKKEEEKELNEVGLNRARLRRGESGEILNVLMAIGSSALVVFLLAIGVMFLLGNLSMHKLQLIVHILQYDKKYDYEKLNPIVGGDEPYYIDKDKYLEIKEQARKFREWEAGKLEYDVVITEEILDHRKDVLERLERNVLKIQNDVMIEAADLKTREDTLTQGQTKLMEDQKAFQDQKDGRKAEQRKKGQAELLKSFSAMEPEDVVNAFTGGKTFQQLSAEGGLTKALDKAVEYVSQMSARQRAGVLQAMEPAFYSVVVEKLEQSYPL